MVQGIQDDSEEVGEVPPSSVGVGCDTSSRSRHVILPMLHCSTRRVPQRLKQKARMNQQLIARSSRKMALQRTPSFQENLDQMIFAQTAIEDLHLRV